VEQSASLLHRPYLYSGGAPALYLEAPSGQSNSAVPWKGPTWPGLRPGAASSCWSWGSASSWCVCCRSFCWPVARPARWEHYLIGSHLQYGEANLSAAP
jgi:hypothetical protein